MRRPLALAVLVLAAGPPAWGAGPPRVVTTTTDLRALVEAVGGDRVQAQHLVPPLQDPHAVEIKPSQLAHLKSAGLLVRVGLDHEPWLPRMLRAVGDPRLAPGGPHDLDASRGIALLQSETPRVRPERGVHLHAFGNTHYWLDPENARPITAAVVQALGRLHPADRPHFEARRARFLADLDRGLARWQRALDPYRGTPVVAVHDTWPYFARRFGLTVVAAVEPTPGVPPSPASLGALIEGMKAARVPLLLAEPSASPALVTQVATRSGARVVPLVPSVGGDPEARDYIALFDVNVRRLVEALGGRR